MNTALSSSENDWIAEYVAAKRENVAFAGWVEKLKDKRTEDRIVVVTQYRLFTLKSI